MIFRLVRGSTNCPAGSKKIPWTLSFIYFYAQEAEYNPFFIQPEPPEDQNLSIFATLHRGKTVFVSSTAS